MKTSVRSLLWLLITPIAAILFGGFATCTLAEQPVITSFETDGTLTWSNAYSEGIAWIERLTDVPTTGSAVTVTETLGVTDGSTVVYNYAVEHPPIVNPSVTISDGTYSWNDVTLSSSPADFSGVVSSYESGQVSAIYLSGPPSGGINIQVEYAYLPVSTTQEWLRVYSEQATGEVAQATVGMSEDFGMLRVGANRSPGMVLIPGGSNSGRNPLASGESYDPVDPQSYPPTYTLTVESFYMDQYEVTKALWEEVKTWNGGNGYDLSGVGSGKALDHPAYDVNSFDCMKWCNARSEKEGRRPVYYTDSGFTQVYKTGQVLAPYVDASADGYRLPTDEEWEYAARGGVSEKRFPWGEDTIQHDRANYYSESPFAYDTSPTQGYHPDWDDDPRPYTSPVGTFEAGQNGYGLYDMAGNVWEWCYDWYPGFEGTDRVVRGGSWDDLPVFCRVGNRSRYYADLRYFLIGFRAVRSPGQQ